MLPPSQPPRGNKEGKMAELGAQTAPPVETTWWSKAILIGGLVAIALLPIGALGTRFGLWTFPIGLLILAAGAVLAAIGLVCGIAGIVAAHRRNLADSKRGVYLGTALCALVLAFVVAQYNKASSVPPIHNISTDVVDPPQFQFMADVPRENTLEYDAERLAPLQQQAYPQVRPVTTALPPAEALERSVNVLRDMDLDVVHVDEEAGTVEATATTRWFGFKDDVVVRVRATDTGSVVDLRSVSRVGLSDLGANAARIQRFILLFEP
jgi:uncharacterized protein (DUF1499 family)